MSSRRVRFIDARKSSDQAAIEEMAALERSRKEEQLENVRLAAQRAHEAMMLARSMQADIRSSNERRQRLGPAPQSPELTSSRPVTPPNSFSEQNILSLPLAWIKDGFLLIK